MTLSLQSNSWDELFLIYCVIRILNLCLTKFQYCHSGWNHVHNYPTVWDWSHPWGENSATLSYSFLLSLETQQLFPHPNIKLICMYKPLSTLWNPCKTNPSIASFPILCCSYFPLDMALGESKNRAESLREGAKAQTQISSGTVLNSVWVSGQSSCAEAKEGLRVSWGTIINNN